MEEIDKKFDMKWMYLPRFIFVDTAFLLCETELLNRAVYQLALQVCSNISKTAAVTFSTISLKLTEI